MVNTTLPSLFACAPVACLRSLLRWIGLTACIVLVLAPVNAQPGQCVSGGCSGPGVSVGAVQTTSSGSFVNAVPGTMAGSYNTYQVTAGQQYEWSLCTADGAVNPTTDAQLTLKNTANATLCYSDDVCGASPKILWTSTLTGQVRVLVHQFSCLSNALSHTVRWRCVSCGPPPGCQNTTQFPAAAIPAPTTATPVSISTCALQTQYSAISGAVAGRTYQVTSSCGGYVTVRQNTFSGTIVAQGMAPVSFTAPAAGSYFIHWNTDVACGTATICCNTAIICTSCAGGGCQNATAAVAVAAPTSTNPVTISTCSMQNQYNSVTGIVAGRTYVIGSSCGGYVTVRQNTFNGPVVVQGNAPLTFTATMAGTWFIHWSTNAACGTATVCCTTTITCSSCAILGCVNNTPLGTVAAPTDDTPLAISACSMQNQYSTVTGIVAGRTYVIGNSCGGHITVRQNTFNGPLVIADLAPLTFTALTSGTYFIHWNTDAACGQATTCCQTTITCNTCVGAGVGGIQVQQNLTPAQLITQRFLGGCLTASNISFTGANVAVGSFTNGYALGIEEGIIITTGRANAALGPNLSGSSSTSNVSGGYPLLTALAGQPTDDAAVFQFTFVPETNEVTFTYVFASEEYPEYVCSNFNDVFGFFVTGPGYAPNTNVATIPGGTLPVAINTVNAGVPGGFYSGAACTSLGFSGLYVNNVGGTHNQYDGRTVPLTATINTVPCQPYTITIAIADAGDNAFDSAVLLKAQSFSGGVELALNANTLSSTSSPANCSTQGVFVFTLDEPLPQNVTLNYQVQVTGQAQYNPSIPLQVTFPAGVTEVVVPVSALPATIGQNLSQVTVTFNNTGNAGFGCNCNSNSAAVTATLYFCNTMVLPVELLDLHAEQEDAAMRLHWRTASEQNTARFEVERMSADHSWAVIGHVDAAGNSTSERAYFFRDAAPTQGDVFYRLRMVDQDGSDAYSPVVRGHFSAPEPVVFPNPAQGVFHVRTDGQALEVIDALGRVVTHELVGHGGQVTDVRVPGALPGCYTVRVGGEGGRKVRLLLQ